MDPNAALARVRELATRVLDSTDDPNLPAWPCAELAEAIQALDGWLTRGGFCPMAWDHEAPTVESKRVTIRRLPDSSASARPSLADAYVPIQPAHARDAALAPETYYPRLPEVPTSDVPTFPTVTDVAQ